MRKLLIVLFFIGLSNYPKAQSWNVLNPPPVVVGTTFLVSDNRLYVGDSYTVDSSGFSGRRTDFFDGSKWDSIPGFISQAPVNALAEYNNELYVAGGFLHIGTSFYNYIPDTRVIARWNGSEWQPAGGKNCNGDIKALAVYKGELYAGGTFTTIGGFAAYHIAKWNGSNWSQVGGGFPDNQGVLSLAVYNDELYAGGFLALPGGDSTYYNLVRWNGAKWDSVGGKLAGWVNRMVVDSVKNILYACGGFDQAGDVPVLGIAQWNGTTWASLSSDTVPTSYALGMYKGDLISGGAYEHVISTGDTLRRIARWDGSKWHPMGSGVSNTVTAIAEYKDNLYVGGYFTEAGGIAANHIACWGTSCPQGVGVKEINIIPESFKVFPNPARNELSIAVTATEAKNGFIRIIRSNGQEVLKTAINEKLNLNVSAYSKGLYIIELLNTKGIKISSEKVVID